MGVSGHQISPVMNESPSLMVGEAEEVGMADAGPSVAVLLTAGLPDEAQMELPADGAAYLDEAESQNQAESKVTGR